MGSLRSLHRQRVVLDISIDPEEGTCETCVYSFNHDRANSDCRCRRFPPLAQSGATYAQFPLVELIDWCGEFRKRNDD